MYSGFCQAAKKNGHNNKVAVRQGSTVYVICKSWQEKGCSSQTDNWQVKNKLIKDFDWQVKFDIFIVTMATWTIEYNLKILLLLSLHKILL